MADLTATVISAGVTGLSRFLWNAFQTPSKWGVYLNGQAQLHPDSTTEFSFRQEYSLPTFPVQDGSFANYNKVLQPEEVHLRVTKGGSLSDRATFLSEVRALMSSLQLYQIRTPDTTYSDYNPMRFEIVRRGPQGSNFVEVDLYFRRVIQTEVQTSGGNVSADAALAMSLGNAVSQSAQPNVSVGTVQPLAPTSAQAIIAAGAVASLIPTVATVTGITSTSPAPPMSTTFTITTGVEGSGATQVIGYILDSLGSISNNAIGQTVVTAFFVQDNARVVLTLQCPSDPGSSFIQAVAINGDDSIALAGKDAQYSFSAQSSATWIWSDVAPGFVPGGQYPIDVFHA